jgi:RNA polymerase sigma-70 factor (ECF subfamily)
MPHSAEPSEMNNSDLGATKVESAEFGALVEPYRRELQVHCYRLLGSLHSAEDLVQETMLRAWQHFDTFKGESSLRTWLYSIATNACLDVLKRQRPRALPAALSPPADPNAPLAPAWAETTWLEPLPDNWLAGATNDPEARYALRESVSLAFLTALQLLPPRQRAIMLLSDVLDWRAREIAELLSTSVSAVKSALHRARTTLSKHYHLDERDRAVRLRADAATQALVERYLHAWETEDVDGLVALMKEDASFTMPPSPTWYGGREAIRALIAAGAFSPAAQIRERFCPTSANGGPAFVVYRAAGPHASLQAFGIQVLSFEANASGLVIADVTTWLDPSLFPYFGFPLELPDR